MGTTTAKLLVLRELAGNAPATLNPIQEFLAPHSHLISVVWWAVWCTVATIILQKLFQAWREREHSV